MAKPDENPGKGNEKAPSGASLTLRMLGDQNGDGLPNYGDVITFDVAGADVWHQINVTISQGGAMVGSALIMASTPLPVELRSRSYTSGAADGHAELINFSEKNPVLAILDFAIGA